MATQTDGAAAHGYLLGYAPLSRHGACWYYVWQAYAKAGASTGMGSTSTAYKGWEATQGKHPGDFNPPRGAAIWLGRRYDGNMDGDVFIAGEFDGDHAATDEPSYGSTGTTSIEARMNLCGREYLGWTDHVLDCPISLPAPPVPPELEDIMRDEAFIIQHEGSLYTAGAGVPGGFMYLNPEMYDIATAGYWAMSNGKTLYADTPIFDTKGNQRCFDVLKLMYQWPERASD